jgi:hypothetical protein
VQFCARIPVIGVVLLPGTIINKHTKCSLFRNIAHTSYFITKNNKKLSTGHFWTIFFAKIHRSNSPHPSHLSNLTNDYESWHTSLQILHDFSSAFMIIGPGINNLAIKTPVTTGKTTKPMAI